MVNVIHVKQYGDQHEVDEELIDVGEYAKKGKLWRFQYQRGKCYDPYEVITRAKEKIGYFEYDHINNNCEHFARWCKTDNSVSRQANVANAAKAASSSFTGGAIGWLFSSR